MGSIKDRNGMDLTQAEDIRKRWQEYIEELYTNDLHGPDNHDGVITKHSSSGPGTPPPLRTGTRGTQDTDRQIGRASCRERV